MASLKLGAPLVPLSRCCQQIPIPDPYPKHCCRAAGIWGPWLSDPVTGPEQMEESGSEGKGCYGSYL